MLDIEQYTRTVSAILKLLTSGTKIYSSGEETNSNLSGEEVMTYNHYLVGYSLELKARGLSDVANITSVVYNDKAFKGLVLCEAKKNLISSLLEQQDDGFDHLIQGKGKGVTLLYRAPGVDKT